MGVGWKLFWDNKRSEGKTMTPKRKTYMASCSKREAWIRTKMFQAKSEIALCKAILNYRHKVDDISKWKTRLDMWKIEFTAYQHELHRLKGIDRVVVPREVQINMEIVGIAMINVATGICKCGERLESLGHVYCPVCGRKILWEKVK